MSTDDVNNISIRPGSSAVLSFCGSAAFGLGIEGMLDLYRDNETRIASVYWNGPWNRIGNEFHTANVDNEHYIVTTSIPTEEGILGELSVVISSIGASNLLQ